MRLLLPTAIDVAALLLSARFTAAEATSQFSVDSEGIHLPRSLEPQ